MEQKYSLNFFFIILTIVFSLSNASAAPLELYRFLGTSANDQLGASVACIGPFGNGSVTSDIVLGIPGGGIGGQVTAYRGASGLTVLYDFISNSSGGTFGRAVTAVGDLNGDTHSDFAVGDPGTSNAIVVFGPDGSSTLNLLNTFAGTGSQYGRSIAGLFSDSNANTTHDVIVGAPLHVNSPGAIGMVSIMDGSTGNSNLDIEGSIDGDALGTAVDSINDYNNDGIRDILVSAPGFNNNRGKVVVLQSADGGVRLTLDGPLSLNTNFGASIASISDLDGDSRDEILIGAPLADDNGTDSGQAFLYSGTTGNLLCTINGNDRENLGTSVAEVGDQALNGTNSFAIGAPGANGNIGQVIIYTYNATSGSCSEIFTLNGTTTGERFGIALTNRHSSTLPTCDLNGDGLSDFGVGTLNQTGNANAGGAVFFGAFVLTPTPTPTPTATPTPTTSSKAPSSATLWYIFENDGTFSVKSELNRDPKGHNCSVSLFGRRSTSDRSKRGPITTLIKGAKAEKINRFRALKLRKVRAERAGRPYLYHLIAQYDCNGKDKFNSNVFARKLTCGLKPLVSVRDWESDLKNKIE